MYLRGVPCVPAHHPRRQAGAASRSATWDLICSLDLSGIKVTVRLPPRYPFFALWYCRTREIGNA